MHSNLLNCAALRRKDSHGLEHRQCKKIVPPVVALSTGRLVSAVSHDCSSKVCVFLARGEGEGASQPASGLLLPEQGEP